MLKKRAKGLKTLCASEMKRDSSSISGIAITQKETTACNVKRPAFSRMRSKVITAINSDRKVQSSS